MKWTSLISTQNLKLAWRRINTGRNLQYKRFFRESYLVYEGSIDDHLRDLHRRLHNKIWEPNHATRIYLPKPSGLQRPVSLLEIEDQILLQAVANIFAKKLYNKRQRVELKTVFSNNLTQPKNSIFFTDMWQNTYMKFQTKCTTLYNKGYTWSSHFDLSAYYDTISHHLLLQNIDPKHNNRDAIDIIMRWLEKWSADNIAEMTGHGIPQGPIASDFLAEAFFLPIDLKLKKRNITYVRYVDDIRIFGKSENDVRQAAIFLEQECRNRGLIPQSTKFAVVELRSPKDAMGSLPSIAPADGKDTKDDVMGKEEAIDLLSSSIKGRPQKITDKSRFRYVMYRAPADSKILNIVCRLLPRHPEHIDAFINYFANYGKSAKIAKSAIYYLRSGLPYSYVRGELWHLIARIGRVDELIEGLPLAREDAKNRSYCVVLSWGVMHFFMTCEKNGLARIGKRLRTEHPISRSLLAPIYRDKEFRKDGHIVHLLKGTLMEQLAGAREMQRRNIKLSAIDLRQRDLKPTCKQALLCLGVVRRRHGMSNEDWIAEQLVIMYGCNGLQIWHKLLRTEYEHAMQILVEAKVRFPSAYSEWLSLQDSLHDLIIRRFFVYLQQKGKKRYSKLHDKKGKLVKYGSLISSGTPFDKQFNILAQQLRSIHDRRNALPGSHPYDQKGGAKNKWLKKRERDQLLPKVRDSLDIIATVVDKIG